VDGPPVLRQTEGEDESPMLKPKGHPSLAFIYLGLSSTS